MIDANMSLSHVKAVATVRAKRLPALLGLGLAAVVSTGLWGALALTVSHIL